VEVGRGECRKSEKQNELKMVKMRRKRERKRERRKKRRKRRKKTNTSEQALYQVHAFAFRLA
jgi:hypothetical protein